MAPEGELEQRIARLWQDALGIADLGALDDDFELGGTSLLAIGILARLHAVFPVEVTMLDLLNARTVRTLAEHIDRAMIAKLASLPDDNHDDAGHASGEP